MHSKKVIIIGSGIGGIGVPKGRSESTVTRSPAMFCAISARKLVEARMFKTLSLLIEAGPHAVKRRNARVKTTNMSLRGALPGTARQGRCVLCPKQSPI